MLLSEVAPKASATEIRPMKVEDYGSLAPLYRRMDWQVPSVAKWRWLTVDNPALAEAGPGFRPGWLLLNGGRPCGFLGNLAQRYWLDGEAVLAAAGQAYLVLPEHRSASLKLLHRFMNQPGVSLLFNTSANETASSIFEFFKFQSLPEGPLSSRFGWVLNAGAVAAAKMRRQGKGKSLAGLASIVGALAGGPGLRLAGHGMKRPAGAMPDLRSLEASAVGEAFDRLWLRLTLSSEKLLAWRDAATLRWRLGDPDAQHPVRLISCGSGGYLDGYVLWKAHARPAIGLLGARILDLQLDPEAPPETADWLLWAAALQARREGCHLMEMFGLPGLAQQRFLARRAIPMPYPHNSYFYRVPDAALAQLLQDPDVWLPSLMDGDASLFY
ncbi:hypothetical protein [Telmatospirillum sp. J64-1]|uniref:hypothetical protein n=1 Tax=Telmatospirillum sp. J64-1 TaxID=2502183 RepID=UPI00115E12A2|nr:hypothetical protein [Telmatospirillum sp. J64-1]